MYSFGFISSLKVDFSTIPYEVKYSASYRDKESRSQANLNRMVKESHPIDTSDIEITKNYACVKSQNYPASPVSLSTHIDTMYVLEIYSRGLVGPSNCNELNTITL
jgi:hypothetical protein